MLDATNKLANMAEVSELTFQALSARTYGA